MSLRYLRHGPTLLWGTVCLVLVGVLGISAGVGGNREIEKTRTPQERLADGFDAASRIRTRMQPLLTLAAGDGENLGVSARTLGKEARLLAQSETGMVAEALSRVASRAEELAAVDPADRDARNVGLMNLTIAVDGLTQAAMGIEPDDAGVRELDPEGGAPGGADPDLTDPQFDGTRPGRILDAG